MNQKKTRVVIVGGGTAGWLTASILASADKKANGGVSRLEVILVESPDIATIGVGEGTWPSMRTTLQEIGVSEHEFIRFCDVSFKQGSKFVGWHKGGDEYYYHPFSLPEGYTTLNSALIWDSSSDLGFAQSVCPQATVCEQNLAPKQVATPEFAFNVNYGYHLNAGKFSEFLRFHCVERLGVEHRVDNITMVNQDDSGYIVSLSTQTGNPLNGDVFVDCSGRSALLIGKHYDIPIRKKDEILFNNRAVAAQVPYSENAQEIQSCTVSTAKKAGWIWDIGLTSRRGVGYTYSSTFSTKEEAEDELAQYIMSSASSDVLNTLTLKNIEFDPGFREKFWVKNCVAIGMSAGFIEPLEASALVMIEKSAKLLSEQFPYNRNVMEILAGRFNKTMHYHWEKIIDFLKLHYILSERKDSPYWVSHKSSDSISESLKELVELWRYQPPWKYDSYRVDELFPSASYQYVLYGMGFSSHYNKQHKETAHKYFQSVQQKSEQFVKALPKNRVLLERLQSNTLNLKV